MKRLACLGAALAVVGVWASSGAHAEVDEVQLRLARQFDMPLRWDNVERAPVWVKGSVPQYQRQLGYHTVRLGPGEQVTLRVPANEQVRLVHADRALAPGTLHVEASYGSGLYATLPVVLSSDSRSLLTHAIAHAPVLVRVSRPAGESEAIEIGLFVSRREPFGTLAPYRDVLPLPVPTVRMQREDAPGQQRFWVLAAERPTQLTLEGPRRLAFEHRPAYAPGESALSQTYRIELQLNGEPWRSLEFNTPFESVYPVEVNGVAQPVGRRQMSYLELPPGTHRLALQANVKLYGRLLGQGEPDYLVAGLNAPPLTANAVRHLPQPFPLAVDAPRPSGTREAMPALKLSPWMSTDAEIQRAVASREVSPSEMQSLSLRLARDNARREGGLQAGMLMREAAVANREVPELQQAADVLMGHVTFYRNLLPVIKTGTSHQQWAFFTNRRIHRYGEQSRGETASLAQLDAWLDRLDQGYFLEVPLRPDALSGFKQSGRRDPRVTPPAETKAPASPTGQVYWLPERHEPTLLRVIADMERSPPGARFYVQLDDAPPTLFQIAQYEELPAAEFAPDAGSRGLSMLALRHATADAGTLGGPFASGPRSAARQIQGAAFELVVGREVRRVSVWREGDAPVFLALQYRTSKPFVLNETAMLAEQMALPRADDALAVLHAAVRTPPAPDDPRPARELANHWQALVRYIQVQRRQLTQGVVPALSQGGSREHASVAARQTIQAARAAEREGQWLLALEHWSTAYRRGDVSSRWLAALGRIEALLQLGETYLAEQQLKSILVSDAPVATRQAAQDRLAARYLAADDHAALATLWAGLFADGGHPDHLSRLIDSLIALDDLDLALAAWLALPEQIRSKEQGLRVTYRLRWWQSFDALLAQVSEPAQRAFWHGWRALDQGDPVAAGVYWQQAGAAGAALRQSLDAARALLPDLRAAEPQTRTAAIARWEQWQATHPGPASWQVEDTAVRDYAGSASLYSVERDTYTQAYRFSEGRPLRLTMIGPIRVRIEVRPLHQAGRTDPLDGWVQVRRGGELRLLPISNNLPAPGLVQVGNRSQLPGQRELLEFSLGPGLHSLEVAGGGMDALARVLTLRPEQPLPVLPPLNVDTAAAVLDGSWQATPATAACAWRDCFTVLSGDGAALRRIRADAASPRLAAADEARLADALAQRPRTPSGRVDNDWPEASALARGDQAAVLQRHPGATPQEAARRMLLLAWFAEQQPDARSRFLSEGEALAARYPESAQVQSMFARLSRDANWLPVPVAQSAGLRTRELIGWQPESPALRVRKALLPALRPREQVLGGAGRLLYDMQTLRSTSVRLHLAMADVEGMVAVPLKAGYQLDALPPRFVTLIPQSPARSVALAIPSGKHRVRAWIETPLANQFLRIQIDDPRALSAQLIAERPYQVATVREPLRFSIAGPAWVRVDEMRDGVVRSRYRYVDEQYETVTLMPPPGRTEGLYRISQRIVGRDSVRSLPRRLEHDIAPVAAPLEAFDLRDPAVSLSVQDSFPLGGQEDGTHSYQLGWHQRMDPDAGSGAAENFLQFDATYRYFDEDRRAYFKTTALARVREQGGPTLGLLGKAQFLPTWSPFNFEIDASLYGQQPGPSSGIEWAAAFAGKVSQVRHTDPKGYHIPYARVFARASSIQSDSAYAAERVDQDVFSRYKQQHPYGGELGDTYYRQPWLDSLWYIGASARTNANFNILQPDQMSFKTGWRQRLGMAQVGVEYQATRYLADDDRKQGYWRNRIDLELELDHWLPSQNRNEWGLRLSHDFDLGEQTGMLYWVWHDGQGRRFRDFGPGEIDFRDIRDRQAPLTRNNRIDGVMGVHDGR